MECVEVDLSKVDFQAWKEDRDELRELRQQVQVMEQNTRAVEEAFAVWLQQQATKINAACDVLNLAAGDLNRTAR